MAPKKEKINFLQMLKKGSKLNSILTGTCPKCQNESMYVDKNPYHLNNVLKMNETHFKLRKSQDIHPYSFYLNGENMRDLRLTFTDRRPS